MAKKNSSSSSKNSELHEEEKVSKQCDEDDLSSSTSSTLSLHITPYDDETNEDFEYPRQEQDEEDDTSVEPEVAQLKASQKLLNPDQMNSTAENNTQTQPPIPPPTPPPAPPSIPAAALKHEKATLAEVRQHFGNLCLVKSASSGRITKNGSDILTIFSQWTSRSPTMKKNLKNSQITTFDLQKMQSISTFDVPVPEAEGQSIVYSSDGKLSAVISTIPGENKEKKHYVRIIDAVNNCDKKIFNLSAKKAHGLVHLSGDFGGGVFSPSGKYLLYTAERYVNPVEFFDADLEKKEEKDDDEEEKKPAIGEKFLWKQTFGEQIYEVNDPVLCLLTVETGEIKVFDSIPKHLHPVQKLFSADEATVYFGAVNAPNYKLGKVFCTNRPFTIGKVDLKDFQYTCIAEKVIGLEYLKRANNDSIFGICRSNDKNSHQGSYSFFALHQNKPIEKFQHDDIFCPQLSSRCFTSKDAIVYTSIRGCYLKAFKFDPTSSQIIELTSGEKSDTVLDVFEDYVLVSRASPDKPPELCLGKFVNDNEVSWTVISKPNPISVDHTCEDVGIHEKFGPHSFVMIPKKSSGKIPLIALIHGGPHSASLKVWPRREPNLLLHLGFAILQINYPGSIGYGEEYVQQLPGKVGELDVQFCEKMIDECLNKFSQLDKTKVSLLGGSHGGFLVTHLAGNKPDNYKSVVSLNPVLNIRTMFDITDIPDWCAYESSGAALDPGHQLDPQIEKAMIERSPIMRAHKIVAPYLLVIGGNDLRVKPHYYSFIRTLSANKVPHKVLYYPESNHALDEVDVEADFSINAALWFQTYGL